MIEKSRTALPSVKTIVQGMVLGVSIIFLSLVFLILLTVYKNLNSSEVIYEVKPVTVNGDSTNVICVAAYKSLGLDLSCFPVAAEKEVE